MWQLIYNWSTSKLFRWLSRGKLWSSVHLARLKIFYFICKGFRIEYYICQLVRYDLRCNEILSTIAGYHIDLVLVSYIGTVQIQEGIHFWLGENMTRSQFIVGLQLITLSEKFGIFQLQNYTLWPHHTSTHPSFTPNLSSHSLAKSKK